MQVRSQHARACVSVFSALALAVALTACGSSSKGSASTGGSATAITAPAPSKSDPTPYPAPKDPMTLSRKAGLVPEDAEQLEYHVHSHLDVYIDGTHIIVPAGLGIDITNPRVHTFTTDGVASYGGIVVACDQPCISPLHTHDVTGILHTESATQVDNTLGQLFIEWNVRLSATCFATYCAPAKPVAFYVNGTKFTGDPTKIALSNYKEIAIVVGTTPAQIPNTADWAQI